MADPTKHFISEIKSVFSLPKTRKNITFIYGFMFVFVGFTIFLAFSPSNNSSSPWFSNIFSGSNFKGNSDRSQFPPFMSYFFHNSSQVRNFTSSPLSSNFTRSANFSENPATLKNFTQNPVYDDVDKQNQTKFASNGTQGAQISDEAKGLMPNQTTSGLNVKNTDEAHGLKPNRTINLPNVKSTTESVQNQTRVAAPATLPVNQTADLPSVALGSSGNKNTTKVDKAIAEKGLRSNYSDSLVKKPGNGANESVSANKGIENFGESLLKCNLFDGEWVKDNSYPLYKPGACSFIDEQFNCILNGRPDKEFQKFKWKPYGCSIPRLNGTHMLELLRGKRLVFVGDSLNRNMWESLVCILRSSAKDTSKVYEANGRHTFRGEASYSFVFKDYSLSVEFFVSPFLVQEWEMADKNGSKKETLRLDLVGRSCDQYKNADIIIFNTGHWWTHDKTSKGKDYYQEGSHVYGELNVLEAFRKAMTTWARWVDSNINPKKSLVFFRGYSDSHFSGGQWNSGGACDHEMEPIKNKTYLRPYPPKMVVLESVLKGMKTHVSYLNITSLTDYRKDGHPSAYRKRRPGEIDSIKQLHVQDCSHWCLPGVPDAWNELLYAELLVRHYHNHQQQKRT